MNLWVGRCAVLLLVAAGVLAIDFRSAGNRCQEDYACIDIRQCSAYKTKQDILRSRPTPCGFSGIVPLVCCVSSDVKTIQLVASTPKPSSTASPLPDQCGHATRTIKTFFLGRRKRTAPTLRTTKFTAFQPSPLPLETSPDFQPERFVAEAVGGFNAVKGKWPWMVLFGRWTELGLDDWFCGGVLVTDQHVLTAAHCLHPNQTLTVGARIGDHDLTRTDDVDHQQRNLSSIVQHPEYTGAQNDLAVVRLAAPVQFTDAVRPICLPPPGSEHVGQDVEMAGWGLLEFAGKPSNILQEVPLRVADPAACEQAHIAIPTFNVKFPGGFQGTKVCAESRDGEPRDACRGDSGGPLMLQRQDGKYQLVGIVSTGVGCGNPDFPGIYTKVSAYVDWILENLN